MREGRQNPSGHITMNATEAAFHLEITSKANRLQRMQQAGLIVPKKTRNPLIGECSPRNKVIIDPSIPPADPIKTNRRSWDYPESDWGLASKFVSQQQVYKEIREKEASMAREEAAAEAARLRNQAVLDAELEKKRNMLEAHQQIIQLRGSSDHPLGSARQKTREDITDLSLSSPEKNVVPSARHGYGAPDLVREMMYLKPPGETQKANREVELSRTYQKLSHPSQRNGAGVIFEATNVKVDPTDINTLQKSTKAFLKSQSREFLAKSSLMDFKASTLRSLQDSNPQVLQQYRTQRALEFANTASRSPPKQDTLDRGKFRPAGGRVIKVDRHAHGKQSSGKLSESDRAMLQNELDRTNECIARQKLAIQLKSKPIRSNYAAPKRH